MYYYGARYYDPRISIFISVDPLAEQFVGWTPYHYVHQNPINLIDPTGMSAEGLEHDSPQEEKKRSATEQGIINVGKKYLATAVSTITNPIGTARKVLGGLAQEAKDFVHEDKAKIENTVSRKVSSAYNSYVDRVKYSEDPMYEHGVVMAEFATEITASILVSKGLSSIASRGTSALVNETVSVSKLGKYFSFSGDQGLIHFRKHGLSVQNSLGRSAYSFGDYMNDANYILQKGTFIPELNGYVKLIGGSGSAKYGFVGLNRETGNITTFHIKTAKELSKSAPNTFKY